MASSVGITIKDKIKPNFGGAVRRRRATKIGFKLSNSRSLYKVGMTASATRHYASKTRHG